MDPRDAEALDFDDANEAHLARHGVSAVEVAQVWCNSPTYAANKRGLVATYLMVGETDGGRGVTVAVVMDEVRLRLRPITAWDSTPGETSRYRGRRAR